MDYMKRATCVNYTAWDLNCPRHIHKHNRQKWEAMAKRAARRKLNALDKQTSLVYDK